MWLRYDLSFTNLNIIFLDKILSMHKIELHIRLLIISAMFISTLHATDLGWENNYDKALKAAKKEKKLVYLLGLVNFKRQKGILKHDYTEQKQVFKRYAHFRT